jgi:hypothetical protein
MWLISNPFIYEPTQRITEHVLLPATTCLGSWNLCCEQNVTKSTWSRPGVGVGGRSKGQGLRATALGEATGDGG